MHTKSEEENGEAVFGSFSQFLHARFDECTKILGNSTFHIVMADVMCYYVAKEIRQYMHAKAHNFYHRQQDQEETVPDGTSVLPTNTIT